MTRISVFANTVTLLSVNPLLLRSFIPLPLKSVIKPLAGMKSGAEHECEYHSGSARNDGSTGTN